MRHYALVGEHLSHSLSVPIHQAVYRHLGLDADYTLAEIPRGELHARFHVLCEELDGFNVTIPYKREIMPLLTEISGFARRVDAVNTVTVEANITRGDNTDVAGFMAMLCHAGIDPTGQAAFILGTGGASYAAETALTDMGASSVTKVSRHPTGSEIGYDMLAERFSGVLVNCTPAGMFPDVTGCPVAAHDLQALLPRACGVADMIYNPQETVLTKTARAAGIPACTGLYMLVRQAVESERIWQKIDMGEELTRQLMKELTW